MSNISPVVESNQISVDLSTLSGWSEVSAGEHYLTIKAKASGYKSSSPSDEVEITKAVTYLLNANLNFFNDFSAFISFVSNGTTYSDFIVQSDEESVSYRDEDGNEVTVYEEGSWVNDNYRTVMFLGDPMAEYDLYYWLGENGQEQ